MKIEAWIQMGCERREVTFDVTEAEIEAETVGASAQLRLTLPALSVG